MSIGCFTDKKVQPDESAIIQAVGPKLSAWQALVQYIRENYPVKEDVKFLYGKTYGWALRFQVKSQVLTALYPTEAVSPFRSI